MSKARKGSERWETCTGTSLSSSPIAALLSPENATVGPGIGTTPVPLPNLSAVRPTKSGTSEPTPAVGSNTKCHDGASKQSTTTSAQVASPLTTPIPITSPSGIPPQLESPGIAPNLLRRTSRAKISAPNAASGRSHLQTLAALMHAHHAAPAPVAHAPLSVLDCKSADQLHVSTVPQVAPPASENPAKYVGGGDGAPTATPGLRHAISGGFLSLRRSGSGSRRVKPARARANTKDLIRRRRASLSAASNTQSQSRSSTPAPSDTASQGTPPVGTPAASPRGAHVSASSALSTLASASALPSNATAADAVVPTVVPREPRLKPKPGAASARSSAPGLLGPQLQLQRSRSTAALPREALPADLEPEVASALEEGLVSMADVNVYGKRTHWQGFRHDDLHELPVATPPRAKAAADDRSPRVKPENRAAAAGSGPGSGSALSSGMPRTASCPQDLAGLSAPALIKPEYSHRNHKQFLDLYELGAVLGTGGYAVVRECTHKASGQRYAAKMMTVSEHPESGGREVDRQALMNELDLMGRLQHPNIVCLWEYFLQDDPTLPHCGACIIIMDLLEGHDLMDLIDEIGGLSRSDVMLVMRCLLDAVSHMHGHGISHRDLKLENLVLARGHDLHSVTIVDFGLAKAARARQRMEGVTGTLWYTAPEILLAEPYSPLVDLWSLGVVMYLLLTGDYPFEVPIDTVPDPPSDWVPSDEDDDDDGSSDCSDPDDTLSSSSSSGGARAAAVAAWRVEKREEMLEDLICDEEPRWDAAVWAADPVAADLTRGLLCKEPRARLSAAEALEHCWFTGHAAHDRTTLKHVHKRVSALAASSEKLPVRTFKAGEWIVRQHARTRHAAECFLLLSGEAAVLMHAPSSPLAEPDSGLLHLCTRRSGNFVGAVQLTVDPAYFTAGGSGSAGSAGSSPCRRDCGGGAGGQPCCGGGAAASGGSGRVCLSASFSSDSVTLASIAWREDSWPNSSGLPHGATVAASAAHSADSTCCSGTRGLTAAAGASLKLRAVFMVMRVAKRWIGHRRTVGVRAETEVTAVVLSHEDMRWAVAADFRMSEELSTALRARRLVVARAIRADKRSRKEAASAQA